MGWYWIWTLKSFPKITRMIKLKIIGQLMLPDPHMAHFPYSLFYEFFGGFYIVRYSYKSWKVNFGLNIFVLLSFWKSNIKLIHEALTISCLFKREGRFHFSPKNLLIFTYFVFDTIHPKSFRKWHIFANDIFHNS